MKLVLRVRFQFPLTGIRTEYPSSSGPSRQYGMAVYRRELP